MTITVEQIEARRKTIGGSDIGAILGENNYKTAYEVWEEKVEGKTVDLTRNKSVVIGNLLESSLIEKYEKDYKKLCISANTFYHKDYEFLSANLDAISVDSESFGGFPERKILEIKTASCFNKDEWGDSGSQIIPKHYYAQIAHYMLVTGYKSADVFVGFIDESIIGEILCEMNSSIQHNVNGDYSKIVENMETRLYTFYRDDEIEELILGAGRNFYYDHMNPWIENSIKNPPPMDFSNKHFRETLRKNYYPIQGSEIVLSNEFTVIKDNYLKALDTSKQYEKIAQEEKAKILNEMGNNEKAVLDDGTYFLKKTIKRNSYTTKDCEYVNFQFKNPKDKKGEI